MSTSVTIDLAQALSSKQGFAVLGGATNDQSGYSVSAAGDVNGDGYGDVIIGAMYASPNSRTLAGESYIIYGSSTNPGTIDLSMALTSTQGFIICGGTAGDESGISVSSAGDVNKDGYDDLIIGAYFSSPNSRSHAGESYVIYGSSTNPRKIDLSVALTSTQGFAIYGGAADDNSGVSVSNAGDVNGDGCADIIIGAWQASPKSRSYAGESYVIYGSTVNPGTIDLSIALTNTQGFAIYGGSTNDHSGVSVSNVGDVNKDGYDDIIIGAYYASPHSRTHAGESYVIYGSAANPGTIDLSVALNMTQGFAILGGAANDQSGVSVNTAGDVNNDGYYDIIIGADTASPNARTQAGESYVIYGSAANPGTIDLAQDLSNSQGFTILGGAKNDLSGCSVSAAGDVNKDGYSDIIIGAPYANPSSRSYAGESYVIYGSSSNPGTIDLSVALTSTQGFVIYGGTANDHSGYSVSTAGDVNNDGYADVIIGAYSASPNSKTQAGESYVIYGNVTIPTMPTPAPVLAPTSMPFANLAIKNIELAEMTNAEGFIILGSSASNSGYSVAGAGDFNNDGYADIMVGVPGIPGTSEEFTDYEVVVVIYGSSSLTNINLLSASTTVAMPIYTNYNDNFGWSASAAGDVNNDGYGDVIIGSPNANLYTDCADNDYSACTGVSYVIYGNKAGLSFMDLSSGTFGFAITGAIGSQSGFSVSTAGDVNKDGYADVIIGAPGTNSNTGAAYVIYGGATLLGSIINLTNLTLAQGFSISGIYGASSMSGYSVAGAGDMNGDGMDDVIIGAPGVQGTSSSGASYIIYGEKSPPATINLASLTKTQGLSITGAPVSSMSGFSVSGAGDFNKDGYADVIIGAPYANLDSGFSYIIYGGKSLPAAINLASLTLAQGFSIIGQVLDYSGYSVSGAGDVNKDGCADVIIGAPNTNSQSGISYVIFGCSITTVTIDLVNLPITQGFSISGANNNDQSGFSVSGAGDVNKDGYDDVIVGAPYANAFGSYAGGAAYVILGGPMPTLAPTPSVDTSLLNTPEFTSGISTASSFLSLVGAWLMRNKIAIHILDNWGHKYILYNPYVQIKRNEIAIKSSLNNQLICIAHFQEYILLDVDHDSQGIPKALYNALKQNIENPLTSQSFKLLQVEKNQIRDYLIAHKYIEPTPAFGCLKSYKELGYVQGTLYNLFLQNFEVGHSQISKKQAREYSIDLSSVDKNSISSETVENLFIGNPVHQSNSFNDQALIGLQLDQTKQKDERFGNANNDNDNGNNGDNNDIERATSKIQAMEISNRDSKSIVSDKEKTNQKSCVIMSIDSMMDPEHVRLQNQAFARFGENLFGYNFLTENQIVIVTPTIKIPDRIANTYIDPTPTADNIHSFASNNNLMISLLSTQQLVEYLPIIKYVAQGFNITLPEVLDNKPILISTHLVLGNAAAVLLPYKCIVSGMITSTIASSSYAIRLVSAGYLADQRQEALAQDEPMSSFETLKYCSASMLAYTLPSIAKCVVTKWFIPEAECPFISYDLGLSASLAGADCYTVYKVTSELSIPTTADVVIPYIADSIAFAITSQYVNIDMSNTAMAMQSVKQCMSVISTIVATDYMSRVAMDMVPLEVKEEYLEPVLNYVDEIYACSVESVNQLIGTSIL